jgi:hypothetical protein
MLSGRDLQRDVIERRPAFPRAAQDGHMYQGQQWRSRGGHLES